MATSKISAKAMQAQQEKKWQVENAVNTLSRAAEIQKDRALMKDVKTHVQNQHKAILGSTTTKRK